VLDAKRIGKKGLKELFKEEKYHENAPKYALYEVELEGQ